MTSVPKTAIVTGASAGIGRELVRQLVTDRGYTVLTTARRRDRLESLAGELPEGSVLILDGDLADAEFRARLWEHGETRLPGGVGVLVNNAGLGHYSDFATDRCLAVDPRSERRGPDGPHAESREAHAGAGVRADRRGVVDPWVHGDSVLGRVRREQARGQRPGHLPALRTPRIGREGLGGLPRTNREQVRQRGAWPARRTGAPIGRGTDRQDRPKLVEGVGPQSAVRPAQPPGERHRGAVALAPRTVRLVHGTVGTTPLSEGHRAVGRSRRRRRVQHPPTANRVRGRPRHIGTFSVETKWFPFPLALSASAYASASAFSG